jgi:hypothetical protein
MQSAEHAWMLQLRASEACGHALPPFVGSARVRLRVCEPTPHVMVQVDHDSNVPSTQSVAHAWALQVRVSSACGQAAPPSVGAVLGRLRFCEPVPHDVVHVDQLPHDAMPQSVAHTAALQPRVSSRYGHT